MKRSITAQAATFAEDARHGYATARETRAAIVAKFTANLTKRAELETEADALGTRDALAADIAALDALFLSICRALDAEGLTLTGGDISALKRQGMPERLAAELDTLHREKVPTIPEAERLAAEDAAALYAGLTRQGLISGPASAFLYYLGKLPTPKPKRPKNGLSWEGKPVQFACFVEALTAYNAARLRKPLPYRTKALCLAFGISERQRLNSYGPALTHEHASCEEIAAIFNTLPGENETPNQ